MTWDEIYERADGAGFGEPALNAKDEARYQVACTMRELGYPDPEKEEIPEESIEDFCENLNVEFDECGNIIDLHLPADIEEMIYRRKADSYLMEDILAIIEQLKDNEEIPPCMELTDVGLAKIVERTHKIADCNIPYNDTLESAIKSLIKGE